MIQGFKLTEEFIQFEKNVGSWEEAIEKSSKPLLDNGYINEEYVKAMIDSVKEYGPYIVIAPNIAMPHARPETGSKKVGFSIMKLEEAVAFSDEEEHKAQLLIALSCEDSNKHMEILQALVMVLSDEEKNKLVFEATTKEEMVKIFS